MFKVSKSIYNQLSWRVIVVMFVAVIFIRVGQIERGCTCEVDGVSNVSTQTVINK